MFIFFAGSSSLLLLSSSSFVPFVLGAHLHFRVTFFLSLLPPLPEFPGVLLQKLSGNSLKIIWNGSLVRRLPDPLSNHSRKQSIALRSHSRVPSRSILFSLPLDNPRVQEGRKKKSRIRRKGNVVSCCFLLLKNCRCRGVLSSNVVEYDYERVEEIREGTEEKIRDQISIFEIAFHVSVRTLATCLARMIKVISVFPFFLSYCVRFKKYSTPTSRQNLISIAKRDRSVQNLCRMA